MLMNGYITGKNRECRSSSLVSVVATDLSNYFKGLDAAEFVVQITFYTSSCLAAAFSVCLCIILLLILMVEASWMNSLTSRLQRKKKHNALFCFFYLFGSIGEYKLWFLVHSEAVLLLLGIGGGLLFSHLLRILSCSPDFPGVSSEFTSFVSRRVYGRVLYVCSAWSEEHSPRGCRERVWSRRPVQGEV